MLHLFNILMNKSYKKFNKCQKDKTLIFYRDSIQFLKTKRSENLISYTNIIGHTFAITKKNIEVINDHTIPIKNHIQPKPK